MKSKPAHPLENLVKIFIGLQVVTLLFLVGQTVYEDRTTRMASRNARQAMRVACRAQVAAIHAQAPDGALNTTIDAASGESAVLVRGKWLVVPNCDENPNRPVMTVEVPNAPAAGAPGQTASAAGSPGNVTDD